jgi:GntR family transcriptional regulator
MIVYNWSCPVMLTRESPKPLYRQLQERLIKDLELGKRLPHSRLPSEREWVKKLGISRITVRQALGELVHQGYLYTVPGKGFFVGERRNARELNAFLSFTASAQSRGEEPASRVLEAKIVRAAAAIAHDLKIQVGSEVVVLMRLRLANGVPMMIQRSMLPHARCPGLLSRDLIRLSLFDTLRSAYNISLLRAETTISARIADRRERRWLDLSGPGVVMVADQISFDSNNAPVERTESVLHPERHPLSLVQQDGGTALGAA